MELRTMDTAALASAFIGARMGEVQLAVAARMLKMSSDDAASVVKLVDAANHSTDRLADVAAGLGQNVDITV